MIKISLERYEDIVSELEPVYVPFFEEVDIYPESPMPNVDHDMFIYIEGDGKLQVVTARDDSNNDLVGFHISILTNDIFYKHILTAAVSHYFLLKEYRGKGEGTKMFEFADKSFKYRGVQRIFMSRKIYVDNEKMFKQLGYTQLESNYTKAI